jgi:arylsulfatase A-like enzyme
MPDDKPNVVLMLADNLGFRDLACYGGSVATPGSTRSRPRVFG